MGLSVSAIRPYSSVSYTQKVDNAYALENQSEISDSYLDAVKNMNSLADIDARMADAMAEYEAIEDDQATAIPSAPQSEPVGSAAIYNLQGQRLDAPQRGVNIIGGHSVNFGRRSLQPGEEPAEAELVGEM